MFDQKTTGRTRSRDDVDDSLGKSTLLEDFRQSQRGEAGGLRRLRREPAAARVWRGQPRREPAGGGIPARGRGAA